MTLAPVRYDPTMRAEPDAACLVCGVHQSPRSDLDHCHRHNLVRGPLCRACNIVMITIDERHTPSRKALRGIELAAFVGHAARCPECLPLTSADLTTDRRRRPYAAHKTATTIHLPADLLDQVRRLAERNSRTPGGQIAVMLERAIEHKLTT